MQKTSFRLPAASSSSRRMAKDIWHRDEQILLISNESTPCIRRQ